jgi:hypothetical protein
LGDLDGDGQNDIVVGGVDGKIHARRGYDGNALWTFDALAVLDAACGCGSSPTGYTPDNQLIITVRSSPALGNLDGDANMEVVVSVGDVPQVHQNGGVIALDHNGTLLPGWPKLSRDINGSGEPPWWPDGHPDGFHSSPALGDLDGDGDLEIVVGGFDKMVYAWHHDGTSVSGWPIELNDTIWSSPALADIDRDGYLEVIIGSDAFPLEPYSPGGSLQVFNHDGTPVAGFPKYIDQTVFSSPAVGDLNNDGWLDIVVGTGNYYAGKGYAVYAWDHNGNPLPGWPAPAGSYVLSSPALGDLDGDNYLEVVVGCMNGWVYGWNHDGTSLTGWPVYANISQIDFISPALADYNGDGDPEVFIAAGWDIRIYQGNGALAGTLATSWSLVSTPAIGNIDSDGALEAVIGGANWSDSAGRLYAWQLGSSSQDQPWPIFHHDARHTGLFPLAPTLSVSPDSIHLFYPPGSPQNPTQKVIIRNNGGEGLNWTAEASLSSIVSITPSSGSLDPFSSTRATVEAIPDGYGLGTHQLGTVTIDGGPGTQDSPQDIPITLHVGSVYRTYLPITSDSHP